MVSTTPATRKKEHFFAPRRIARDYAFVMPGFFISLLAFVLLLPLALLSIATFIVWIGALLLPVTLRIATGFAGLSRTRLRRRGIDVPPTHYARRRPGFAGLFASMGEPRRWLDLVFETVVAFPLRTFTFVVASAWTATAIGGITHVLWGIFLPRDEISLAGLAIEAITGGAATDAMTHSYLLDTGFNFVIGVVFLLTLPFVMRWLAQLDATVTAAALGGAPETGPLPASATLDADAGSSDIRQPAIEFGRALSSENWTWIAVGLVAVVSVAINWPVLGTLYGVPVVVAMVISLAQGTALLLAVRWPVAGIALQTGSAVATLFAAAGTADWPWPWPVTTLILQAVLVLLIALRKSWPWAAAAWAFPHGGVLLAAVPTGIPSDAGISMIVSASVSLGLLVLGVIIRQLATSRGALQAERLTSAELGAQRRELSERNRIAQELHDVVAHSMSVISVQATTAKYRLPPLDPEVELEFQSIAGSSRQALSEMRSLLSLLRTSDDDREIPLAPQPTLAEIPALVEASRRSGAEISLRMSRGDDSPEFVNASVPAATSLTAYRIVQEALSNAMRHSPGSGIVVVVENDHGIAIDVSNGPPKNLAPRSATPGTGLGLAGVRERTAALGGTVEAGPTGAGGFRVRAVLPLDGVTLG